MFTAMDDFLGQHETLLKVTKAALSTCLKDRWQECPQYPFDDSKFLPTRLLDLKNLSRPKLIVTAENEVLDRRYVPLSHQWGTPNEAEKRAMITTMDTIQSRMAGFELSSLPARYQTAIMLCHCMGIRYIWIDSICIVQDSTGDWELECPTMERAYECGVFTICSNLSANEEPWFPPHLVEWAIKLWKGGPNAPWLSHVLRNGPLSERAWCLQEHQLSPRIIHVFHGMTWIWECNTLVRGCNSSGLIYGSDVIDRNLPWRKINFFHMVDHSEDNVLHLCDILLADYSRRKLTYEADKLYAISAIAQKLQPMLSRKYLAGFWEADVYGLMWHCDNFFKLRDFLGKSDLKERNLEPKAVHTSSWHWASMNVPTYYLGTTTPTEKILEINVAVGLRLSVYGPARERFHERYISAINISAQWCATASQSSSNEAIVLSGYACEDPCIFNRTDSFDAQRCTTHVSLDIQGPASTSLLPRDEALVQKISYFLFLRQKVHRAQALVPVRWPELR